MPDLASAGSLEIISELARKLRMNFAPTVVFKRLSLLREVRTNKVNGGALHRPIRIRLPRSLIHPHQTKDQSHITPRRL